MTFPLKTLTEAGVAVLDCEHKTPKAQTFGAHYIAIPDVVEGRINLATTRRITDSDLEEWTRRTRPQAGDVLVTRRGRVGDTAVIPDVACAIGQNLVLLRSDGVQVDQGFLRWAARSPLWWSEVERLRNVGAVFSSLNVKDIARMRVPVPDPNDQVAIAEVLGALDDKIAANANLVALADELAKTLTRSTMTGAVQPLSSIAAITMGSSPPGSTYNETGIGTVFYQGIRDFGVRFPTNRIWTDAPVRVADAGDTLLSVRAPVGRTNLASERTCIGRGLAGIRSTDGRPMTLFHLLRDSPEVWAPYEAEGTVFGSINKRQLSAVLVGVVDSPEAERLEETLAALERRLASAIKESDQLAAVRDALLPQLMSGRIRVRDAERVVEGVV